MSLHPSDGARFLLELEEGAEGARYRGAIYLPDRLTQLQVTVGASGEVSIAPAEHDPPLPPRALDLLRGIARAIYKDAAQASPRAWPRRVLRWKRL
jgi:hypothetical protein